MTDDELALRLAPLVREGFCAAMRCWCETHRGQASDYGLGPLPRWDGCDEDADGRRHEPVWPKLAAFILEHELSLRRLLDACFADCPARPPTPAQLCSARSLERYERFQKKAVSVDLARRALQAEFLALEGYLAERRLWPGYTLDGLARLALRDQDAGISHLFRYCLAVHRGFTDLAEVFLLEARSQYRGCADVYDQAWGEWIPSGLRAAPPAEAPALLRFLDL